MILPGLPGHVDSPVSMYISAGYGRVAGGTLAPGSRVNRVMRTSTGPAGMSRTIPPTSRDARPTPSWAGGAVATHSPALGVASCANAAFRLCAKKAAAAPPTTKRPTTVRRLTSGAAFETTTSFCLATTSIPPGARCDPLPSSVRPPARPAAVCPDVAGQVSAYRHPATRSRPALPLPRGRWPAGPCSAEDHDRAVCGSLAGPRRIKEGYLNRRGQSGPSLTNAPVRRTPWSVAVAVGGQHVGRQRRRRHAAGGDDRRRRATARPRRPRRARSAGGAARAGPPHGG